MAWYEVDVYRTIEQVKTVKVEAPTASDAKDTAVDIAYAEEGGWENGEVINDDTSDDDADIRAIVPKMRTVSAYVNETVEIQKYVSFDLPADTPEEKINSEIFEEAFSRLITEGDHGWDVVSSEGYNIMRCDDPE